MDAELKVEVIYVDVARSFKKSLLLPAGSRVADALAASGIERELGAVNPQRIGIFNRPCTRQTFYAMEIALRFTEISKWIQNKHGVCAQKKSINLGFALSFSCRQDVSRPDTGVCICVLH